MTEKPAEIKAHLNGPRSRAPAAKAGLPVGGQMLAYGGGYPPPMPYGYPPYPYGPPPLPMPPIQPPAAIHTSLPGEVMTMVETNSDLEYPSISNWLNHCDQHPKRSSYKLSQYINAFDKEGFVSLDQLAGPHISIEGLAGWLNLGKGTTDLIIRYAEHDVLLIKNRKFQLQGRAT